VLLVNLEEVQLLLTVSHGQLELPLDQPFEPLHGAERSYVVAEIPEPLQRPLTVLHGQHKLD
jgi:hypothetical protein